MRAQDVAIVALQARHLTPPPSRQRSVSQSPLSCPRTDPPQSYVSVRCLTQLCGTRTSWSRPATGRRTSSVRSSRRRIRARTNAETSDQDRMPSAMHTPAGHSQVVFPFMAALHRGWLERSATVRASSRRQHLPRTAMWPDGVLVWQLHHMAGGGRAAHAARGDASFQSAAPPPPAPAHTAQAS